MKRSSVVVGTVVAVLVAFVAAMFIYQNRKGQERNKAARTSSASLVQFHAPTTGPTDAKVTIVEFFGGNPQVQRVWGILQTVGLDVDKAKRDMDNPRFDAILKQDAQDIAVLQVKKTPTFFVNGRPLLEHNPDALRAMLLQEIKASYP